MTIESYDWDCPPSYLQLNTGQVHIWRASLELSPSLLDNLEACLSEDEIDRANRFRFIKDRSHFVAARGCLRDILGYYLGISPKLVKFSYSQYGKPDLDGELNPGGIRFNISHSHSLGLFAFTRLNDIGIDIEYIRSGITDEGIARRFFSQNEVENLFSLPDSLRKDAFFNCWTRKEAYIKAHGEGLSLPLDHFDVTLTPGEPASIMNTRPDPDEAKQWTLHEINPGSGYVAAVAFRARKLQLKYWQWSKLVV